MRSKFVFVSHPSPLNPLPPCSAGTDGIGAGIGVRENWIGILVGGNVAGSGSGGRGRARVAGRRRVSILHRRRRSSRSRQRVRPTSHAVVSHHPPNFPFYYGISACNGVGMVPPRAGLFNDLERFVSSSGVQVRLREMDLEKPGEFDGPTITINPAHDRQACCYYLAHSFGSIYQWSTDFEHARKVFGEIRDTKRGPQGGFEAALRALATVRGDVLRPCGLGACRHGS